MTIFNSLGSNYNWEFVHQALLATNKTEYSKKLKNLLEERYRGEAVLVYKGREALQLALRASNQKGNAVGICGFTCFAVYEAITREGYKVEYIDIDEDNLNFSFANFEKAARKNPKLKILIIQNTLGDPCDIEKISKYCQEKGIILIEDLAHSIGANYTNGKKAGTVGDFTILSFSQDKMVDSVSGGAVIVRNPKFKIQNEEFKNVSANQERRDRLYPFFTFLIKKTYASGLGKIFHLVLKKSNALSKPMNGQGGISTLPNWYCRLAYQEVQSLEKNLEHRKKIAQIYKSKLDERILSKTICDQIGSSSNLRFPIFVEKREELINYLKEYGIFVSDIWYDAPIAPKKYLQQTNYDHQCIKSERVSERILNLPTHKNVTENIAFLISERINIWLKSQ